MNRGLVESVGLMVYEGTQSLNYVDNYAHGSSQWEGFPITVDVTMGDIMLGCKGSARSGDIMTLAGEAIAQEQSCHKNFLFFLMLTLVFLSLSKDEQQIKQSVHTLPNTEYI